MRPTEAVLVHSVLAALLLAVVPAAAEEAAPTPYEALDAKLQQAFADGKPEDALAFRPGERVADIGAGSGYFTVRVARAVGDAGRVLAIDASQEMLDHLATRISEEGLGNVTLAKVERDDPALPAAGVDTVLMVDTLHYVADKPGYARKLAEGLAPGGRVVIIDSTPKPFEERPWGPPPHQQFSREELDAVMASAGLRPSAVHDFLPEQYFVEYRRAEEPAPGS